MLRARLEPIHTPFVEFAEFIRLRSERVIAAGATPANAEVAIEVRRNSRRFINQEIGVWTSDATRLAQIRSELSGNRQSARQVQPTISSLNLFPSFDKHSLVSFPLREMKMTSRVLGLVLATCSTACAATGFPKMELQLVYPNLVCTASAFF
jgi:hypothetical protein